MIKKKKKTHDKLWLVEHKIEHKMWYKEFVCDVAALENINIATNLSSKCLPYHTSCSQHI